MPWLHLLNETLENALLVAAGILIFTLLRRQVRLRLPFQREVAIGFYFGALALLSMSLPMVLPSGVLIDARHPLVLLATAVGGVPAGLITTVLAGAYRLHLGGPTWLMGVATTVCVFFWAVACRRWLPGATLTYRHLFILGLGAAAVMVLGSAVVADPGLQKEAILQAVPWSLITVPGLTMGLGVILILEEERRTLRRTLADSEARMRSLAEHLPHPMSLVDREDRFLVVNRQYEKMTGIRSVEIIGKRRNDVRAQLGLPTSNATAAVLATGEVQTRMGTGKLRGVEHSVISTYFPVRDADGAIVTIGCCHTDVTEFGRAREALAARDQLLARHRQLLVEAVGSEEIFDRPYLEALRHMLRLAGEALGTDAAAALHGDLAGKVDRMDRWERATGAHSVPATNFDSVLAHFLPELVQDGVLALSDLLAEPRLASRANYIHTSGTRALLVVPLYSDRRLHGALTFSRAGAPHQWSAEEINFARSIADLLGTVHLACRHREALTALDVIDNGIFVQCEEGRVIYANRSALALAGISRTVTPAQIASGLPSASFPQPAEPLEDAHDAHLVRHTQGGSSRELSIERNRLPDGGTIVYLRDVTSRNAERRERARLEAQLQQAGKLKAIGQLASGIAHDFNNLLGAVVGFATFLEQDLPASSEQHKWAHRILHACDRGRSLVAKILTFARPIESERRILNLSELVRESADLLRGMLPASIDIDLDIDEESIPIDGDAALIEQVLINLSRNASDAMRNQGRILISVTADPATDDFAGEATCSAAGRRLARWGTPLAGRVYGCIEVSDQGDGMDSDALSRLFEPFYTTKARGRGTGLGLSMVHGIVAAHNGLIAVESAAGRGTIFRIYLPLERRAPDTQVAPAAAEGPAEPASAHGSERVLLVDDETDITDVLLIGLDRLGYEVAAVTDPLEALAAFEEDPDAFDVVLSDFSMPGLDGNSLIRRLREIRPQLRTILWSGLDRSQVEGDFDRIANAFLQKPASPRQVGLAIRSVMAG